jgi:hypothetical protein
MELAATLCEGNEGVILETYPTDHGGILEMSWPDIDAWMQDRFAGTAPVGNCPS